MAFYVAQKKVKCFHCNEETEINLIRYDQKDFCCEGCKSVYQLLKENDLAAFYNIDKSVGNTLKNNKKFDEFAFLNNLEILNKLHDFQSDSLNKITLNAPAIHCSSCIWLLENLYKINKGVLSSEVNFVKKEIYINYNPKEINLQELVYLLSKIGYEPDITLDSLNQAKKNKPDRSLWYKLGVAGFAFGNIMLFSLPSYFGLEADSTEKDFDLLFKIINVFLSLPVLLYSASEFLKSAYNSLKNKQINLDVPLCLGILALFGTSMYEIFSNTGPGYLDSFTALIFFLLAGRAIQKVSFEKLKFDRDNNSYFPLSVIKLEKNNESYIPVTELKIGDLILLRNNELIPADGVITKGNAFIDYSFVTGEAIPVTKNISDAVYAGGKQTGGAIELKITKLPSQSYLTQLWNLQKSNKDLVEDYKSVVNKRSKYFTYAVLIIAFSALIYWTVAESFAKGILVFATTLNVSCPCALAVAIPFTYSNIIRHLGKHKFFVKNPQTIERISTIDSLAFDKTGTLTNTHNAEIHFEGTELSTKVLEIIKSGIRQSTHPLSIQLYKFLKVNTLDNVKFTEEISKGLEINYNEIKIKIGSHNYVCPNIKKTDNKTCVYISVNDEFVGRFIFQNQYINGLDRMVQNLNNQGYNIDVISGDNEAEKENLQTIFSKNSNILFNQKPENKLAHIKSLQQKNQKVMMIGDGLNDAVALQQSNVGIAVINDNTQFSPASDVIIAHDKITNLPLFIKYCKSSIEVIKSSFIFSSIYNTIGLSFAVQGLFSPVFAAILMPVSSVTVVLFSVLLTNYKAKKIINNL